MPSRSCFCLCTVYYYAVAPTPMSHYTRKSTASTCHIPHVLITQHMRKSLATRVNLLPYLDCSYQNIVI